MRLHKRMVLGCVLICLTSTTLLPREHGLFSEKNVTQAFGAYLGGWLGGFASLILATELLDVAHRPHHDTRMAVAGWVGCGALVSAYCCAKLFWYLTPDAIIEKSQSIIERHGKLLTSLVTGNFYSNLNIIFVGDALPLLSAFNHIKSIRKKLVSQRCALIELKKRNKAWREEVKVLLPEIERLLSNANYCLALITSHPDWAQCLTIEEMQLARLTPQVHYVY